MLFCTQICVDMIPFGALLLFRRIQNHFFFLTNRKYIIFILFWIFLCITEWLIYNKYDQTVLSIHTGLILSNHPVWIESTKVYPVQMYLWFCNIEIYTPVLQNIKINHLHDRHGLTSIRQVKEDSCWQLGWRNSSVHELHKHLGSIWFWYRST